jgi:hypothetical protein
MFRVRFRVVFPTIADRQPASPIDIEPDKTLAAMFLLDLLFLASFFTD